MTWDAIVKQRLFASQPFESPVTCLKYDPSGKILAVGLGYDWSLGVNGRSRPFRRTGTFQNRVMVIPMREDAIKGSQKR